MTLIRIVYNLFFPLVLIIFLPGMLWKLWRRPGWKRTYAERFGIFSKTQKKRLAELGDGVIWLHSVSVGETQIAISMVKKWLKSNPDLKLVVSTTTTTGQAIARKEFPENVVVIFCPLDFYPFMQRAIKLIRPKKLVIFETEIWPEMVFGAKRAGAKILLANGRMSDKSSRGYHRFACFFAPILRAFSCLCVQTETDKARYQRVAADLDPQVTGNMKFDQSIPENLMPANLNPAFGEGNFTILLAASTHPGEEGLIADCYVQLRQKYPELRLVIVPRHAERGAEIEKELDRIGLSVLRRSNGNRPAESSVDVLLADTTGEMLSFMAAADIVIMGKSLAGQDEGHNLIEPALLSKPIVTGAVLKNFRFVLDVLTGADAVCTVPKDSELAAVLEPLITQPSLRNELGAKARAAIAVHEGATQRTIHFLETLA